MVRRVKPLHAQLSEHDRRNLDLAREWLRTPAGRPPFELDWARRVLARLEPQKEGV